MPEIQANGITIAYDDSGPVAAPAVLLITGLAARLTLWPQALVERIAADGFRVIRYDNRDFGLSEHITAAGMPDFVTIMEALRVGQAPQLAYRLDDMAADAVGLMDALGIAQAHIVGGCLGGMIAQIVALQHPARVRSLAPIFTSSGNRCLPSGYPDDEHGLAPLLSLTAERRNAATGPARQFAAILAAEPRDGVLRQILVPTLVVHGDCDPLFPLSHGIELAENIPNARLMIIGEMGHDLPPARMPELAAAMIAHFRAAQGSPVLPVEGPPILARSAA